MELCLIPTVVGKGDKGRTACGSSAYRSCDKLVDAAGNVHDFRNKSGYVTGGVELPAGAPEELRNRQILWLRHEEKDIRKDASLYRDVMVILPNEIDYAAAQRVVKGLASKLTDRGMCVQWDIHDTTQKGKRNLHSHLMITMRDLNPDGTFGNKNRSWNKYNGGLNIADLLRPEAARLMNDELALIGSSERVEHKSYAERGVDKIPTKHMGAAATAMERKGIKTNKGRRNRYIEWLNQIHAENLRQVETQTQSGRLEDLIAGARAQGDGSEAFKDWDALFALIRDTRRSRAAMKNELRKLGKVISAYKESDEGYLRWAGCDPNNDKHRLAIQSMQDELRIKIKEMDVTEGLLLDSKELYKAHNKVYYTAKKAAWDQYQVERNKKGMVYCDSRLESIDRYMDSLKRSISLFDILFDTQVFKDYCATMDDLERQRDKLREQYAENRAALKRHLKELKVHQKEMKKAEREEKKVRRERER